MIPFRLGAETVMPSILVGAVALGAPVDTVTAASVALVLAVRVMVLVRKHVRCAAGSADDSGMTTQGDEMHEPDEKWMWWKKRKPTSPLGVALMLSIGVMAGSTAAVANAYVDDAKSTSSTMECLVEETLTLTVPDPGDGSEEIEIAGVMWPVGVSEESRDYDHQWKETLCGDHMREWFYAHGRASVAVRRVLTGAKGGRFYPVPPELGTYSATYSARSAECTIVGRAAVECGDSSVVRTSEFSVQVACDGTYYDAEPVAADRFTKAGCSAEEIEAGRWRDFREDRPGPPDR